MKNNLNITLKGSAVETKIPKFVDGTENLLPCYLTEAEISWIGKHHPQLVINHFHAPKHNKKNLYSVVLSKEKDWNAFSEEEKNFCTDIFAQTDQMLGEILC